MTTELQLQEGLQTQIRSLDAFDTKHVVINDWTLLDERPSKQPLFIIANTDTLDAAQAASNRSEGTIPIYGTLCVRFSDWKPSLDLFRDTRQAIVTLFENTTGARSLGLEAVTVETITAGTAVDYLNIPDGNSQLPIWIVQRLDFNVRLF